MQRERERWGILRGFYSKVSMISLAALLYLKHFSSVLFKSENDIADLIPVIRRGEKL